MRRLITFMLVCMVMFTNGFCTELNLKVKAPKNPPPGANPPSRSPMLLPSVDQEDHNICIDQFYYEDMTIYILNGTEVVYSVVVPAGTTQIQLPDSLRGYYEFDLVRGNYCFYCNITL